MQNEPITPVRGARKPETKVFSIRLTQAERRHLLDRAGSIPLGAYVRGLVMAPEVHKERRRMRNPVKDHQALARVLAALGQSRLSSNLNQLAKAVNIGVLPLTPETEQDIVDACDALKTVRADLVKALGLEEGL